MAGVGTLLAAVGIWLLCTQFSLPAFANIVHGMGERSPIFAHTIPWNAMAFSLGLSAILFFAALKDSAETRVLTLPDVEEG